MSAFIPECVLFMGLQASGKSTFYHTRFYDTHARINLDMLKTRHREEKLFQTCLEIKQHCVIDNTNPTRVARMFYISKAKSFEFTVTGYYFESKVKEALERNSKRDRGKIPEKGILATYKRLELPSKVEGFDEPFYVKLASNDEFSVEAWRDEI
jgi:predicted kinase